MVLALLAASVLGAGPQYSVIVARRIGVDPKKANDVAKEFAGALEAQSAHPMGTLVPLDEAATRLSTAGFPDASVCAGASACVSSLAKVSGLTRLVALQLVKAGNDLAIDASVVEGQNGQSIASATRTVKFKSPGSGLKGLAAELVKKVPEVVAPPPLPPAPPEPPLVASGDRHPADAPVEHALTPPIADAPPQVVAPGPGLTTGRKVSLGLGGGAVVLAGIGVALGVSALSQANTLSALDPSYEQKAAAARRTANIADACYGTAGALAVGAVVAWVLSPPAAP